MNIMKVLKLTLIIFSFILFLSSCTYVLDMVLDVNMQLDEVLTDPDRVEALLNSCYNNIPQKGYSYWFFESLVVAASDDGYTSDEGQGVPSTALYQDNN